MAYFSAYASDPPVTLAVAHLPGAQVEPVFEVKEPTEDQCHKMDLSAALYPVDVIQLESLLNSDSKSATPQQTIVTIADTGLDGAGTGIFTAAALIGLLDQAAKDRIKPQKSWGEWFHGTAVASLVLGGPTFAGTGGAAGIIRLNALQIYVLQEIGKERLITTKPGIFASMMNGNSSGVVSLSLKTTLPLDELQPYMGPSSITLFVVAAGNDGQRLAPDLTRVFPAMLGGPDATHVLTVAAWDSAGGKLAGFSNWGEDYIEIAAPGCYVPTMVTADEAGHWKRANLSGTSLATPIVAFTAALLRAYLPTASAADVKQRILASSDLNKVLAGKVADGRLLNPIKAMAIYDDVVQEVSQVAGQTGPLRFGDLTFMQGADGRPLSSGDALTVKCKNGRDSRDSLPINSIRKIVSGFLDDSGSDPTFLVYTGGNSGKPMMRQECIIRDVVVRLKERESGDVHSYRLDQLADIIPRVTL